jgi:hypothetical protein
MKLYSACYGEREGKIGKVIYKKTLGPTITITNPFAIGWLLVLVGIVPMAIGVFIQWNTLTFLPGTVSTTGTVIRCDTETTINSQGQHTYLFPVVSFQTQSGQHITFEASESDGSCFEGNTATVRYHPNDPQDARLNSNIWLGFAGFGLGFILLSLFNFLRGIIRKVKGNKPIANSRGDI